MSLRLFTSESVTEGHPDKVCDQVSDAILDDMLRQDPMSRVAVETMVTTGLVHVAGEVTTEAYVDIPSTIRAVVRDIGYTSSSIGFDADSCGVSVSIGEQSPDIWLGVGQATDTDAIELGAGDQGLMFGYACRDTAELMPLPIAMAHALTFRLAQVRKEQVIEGLRPDGKAQVTIGYDGDTPISVDTVVVSTQHREGGNIDDLRQEVEAAVIAPVLARYNLDSSGHRSLINPTGRFEIGGPMGDAGLTGRKIIVDTYGGMARHGGGAFSGKDPSKVDRSAAYAMRWVAKNIVAAGLADRCELQVAYAIGTATPVGLYVETFNTHTVDPERIVKAVREVFDLRPSALIAQLDLRRPIYRSTASYGHFGRELPDFTWERTDRADALAAAV
ncbi:methionine adenosyltransferase [Demequina sp.]|uniref:methionine adenosyltransferase n=1 Tax=Demequina sp. TaxID=2050685 RepID=UPI0025BE749A|nr:methionine adenosyltransferase [Demequina sp.]